MEPLDVWVPKFEDGAKVEKRGTGYSGPGEVVCSWRGKDGHVRYVVEHEIAGGKGQFYHIYGEGQLTRKRLWNEPIIPGPLTEAAAEATAAGIAKSIDEDLADQIQRQVQEELELNKEKGDG